MDSVNQKASTPSKSRLARTFAKVLHIRAVTGVAPVDKIQKSKTQEKVKPKSFDDENVKIREREAKEAFLAKLFASISAIKAAYAQIQFSQSPYDPDGIQSADQLVVSELKNLSEFKQCYLKKQFDESSPETALLLAEIKEQSSLLRTYEITGKKLDSQMKLKKSEITFLKEKLDEANKENKLIEKRLNSSGLLSVLDNLHLSGMSTNHFISVLRQTIRSIRSFVRLMIGEMESSGWDLDAAASSIEPGIVYASENHRCFAFESFVCREMFDGFNYPNFSPPNGSLPENKKQQQRVFFDRFMALKSVKPKDYLAMKPKSVFGEFCRTKYLRLVHLKMESSLFGNLNQRNSVSSGEYFPETTFFTAFGEMAKRVWILHCLAFCFNPEASIFQVAKGCRFSEVYMQSVSDDEPLFASNGSSATDPRVAFTVVPGFKICKTVIQCQVYLS